MNNHVVGTAHKALRLTIHVPVEADEVPLFVRTSHEVGTEIDPPKSCTVEFVTFVMMEFGCIGSVKDVACIVALDHQFHHTVTINIAQGHVVDDVLGGHIVAIAVKHSGYGNVEIAVFPSGHSFAFLLLHSTYNGCHLITAGGITRRVGVVRHLEIFCYA